MRQVLLHQMQQVVTFISRSLFLNHTWLCQRIFTVHSFQWEGTSRWWSRSRMQSSYLLTHWLKTEVLWWVGKRIANLPHPDHFVLQQHTPIWKTASLSTFKSPIKHCACSATWSIFVPIDSRLCIAVAVPDHKTLHNHPMPPMIKVAFDAKSAYCKCINQTGVPTATTKKVNNCMFSVLNDSPHLLTLWYSYRFEASAWGKDSGTSIPSIE